jgi:hypothetical protein
MAQMKHRAIALCQHLRSAIDIFEQIAAEQRSRIGRQRSQRRSLRLRPS